MNDRVNHPSHYNSHPSGIEFIEIGRHFDFNIGSAMKYLWRNGLKDEEGYDQLDKQIEDLKKAVWYINDQIKELEKVKEAQLTKEATQKILEENQVDQGIMQALEDVIVPLKPPSYAPDATTAEEIKRAWLPQIQIDGTYYPFQSCGFTHKHDAHVYRHETEGPMYGCRGFYPKETSQSEGRDMDKYIGTLGPTGRIVPVDDKPSGNPYANVVESED